MSRRLEYYKYLDSQEWRDLKAKALVRDKHKCQKCGSTKRLEGHHKQYGADFRKVDVKWIEILCHDCHAAFHAEKVRKRREARKLRQLLGHVPYLILEFDAF